MIVGGFIMNKKYDSLFKELISSYYSEDNFDEKLNDIVKIILIVKKMLLMFFHPYVELI